MSQQNLQVFEMLSTLLVTISRGQHILQSIRQVLTSNPLFNPLSLFKYLTKGNTLLTRKHLITFLEQNDSDVNEEQIKILFQCYGFKQTMQYTDFMHYVYPLNSGIIRQVANVHSKRYNQTEKITVNQDIAANFFLLITQELQLIQKLQVQKTDSMPKMPKQRLRKILKSIKKASEKQMSHTENKENTISSLELRNFIKAFVQVGEHQFLHLGRRLGMDSHGIISMQNMEFWIRPWKKQNKSRNLTPKKKADKKFNENNYRQSIHKELSQTLNLSKQQVFQCSGNKQNGQNEKIIPSFRQSQNRGNQRQKRHQILKGGYLVIFKEFVDKLVSTSQDLQRLKTKFNEECKVNLLQIFKKIDVYEKGTIKAQDLKKFYLNIGGIPINTDFSLIVDRYSETGDKQLSFSQFCDIFCCARDQDNKFQRPSGIVSQEAYRIISQILYMNLQSQSQLKKVISKFKKGQARMLFETINKQGSGFINYQELKKFLNQYGKVLSMQDLMMILKRLDRSKNGVVVQAQFIQYFQPASSAYNKHF